uniref:Uncharacterized protein n=1 Tax=Arundo donax TaxID=35708 RepID=A0A0A9BY47_ARUDO
MSHMAIDRLPRFFWGLFIVDSLGMHNSIFYALVISQNQLLFVFIILMMCSVATCHCRKDNG